MPAKPNGSRITLAVLGERVAILSTQVAELTHEVRQLNARLAETAGCIPPEAERRLREVEASVVRLEERQGRTTTLLAIFQAISSTLATVLGRWGQ